MISHYVPPQETDTVSKRGGLRFLSYVKVTEGGK